MRPQLFLSAILLVLCALPSAALAQEGLPASTVLAPAGVEYLPDAPHVVAAVETTGTTVASPSFSDVIAIPRLGSGTEARPAGFLLPAPPLTRKIFDRKFVALAIATFALTTMDVEMTQHCLAAHTCYEMNPTLPSSRWGQYVENSATNLAVMYFSYRRRKAGKWGWWIPPAVDIGAHVVGVGSNLKFLK